MVELVIFVLKKDITFIELVKLKKERCTCMFIKISHYSKHQAVSRK